MKVTLSNEVSRQVTFEYELDDSDLEPYLERAYREHVKHTTIPGFRKGRVPRALFERHVGRENLANDIAEEVMSDITDEHKRSKEFIIFARELKEVDPFRFTITAAKPPTANLGDYHSIRVERKVLEVTEDQVDEEIGELQLGAAIHEPVDRNVAQLGDIIIVDLTHALEGEDPEEHHDRSFELDPEISLQHPGFTEQMVGAVKGEPKSFSLNYPYWKEPPEKTGEMTVTIKEIKVRRLLPLNDDFPSEIGSEASSLAELRDEIREELMEQAENSADDEHRSASLEALIDQSELLIPQLFFDLQVSYQLNRTIETFSALGIDPDMYETVAGQPIEEMVENNTAHAKAELIQGTVLDALVEAEGIEVADEEIEARLEEHLAERHGGQDQSTEMTDRKRNDLRAKFGGEIARARALDRLAEIASGDEPAKGGLSPLLTRLKR